jgi:hypothetical protein
MHCRIISKELFQPEAGLMPGGPEQLFVIYIFT